MTTSTSRRAGFPAMGSPALMAALQAGQQGTATDEGRTLYALGLSIAASASQLELTAPELALAGRVLADGVLRRPAGTQPGCVQLKAAPSAADAAMPRLVRPPEREFPPPGVRTRPAPIFGIERLEALAPTQGGLQ